MDIYKGKQFKTRLETFWTIFILRISKFVRKFLNKRTSSNNSYNTKLCLDTLKMSEKRKKCLRQG